MTNKKVNLFLINTPFQLICALEAKAEYGLENNILAVTKQAHEKSQKQLDSLLKKSDWDYIINLPGTAKAFTVPYFIYSLKKFSPDLSFSNTIFPDYLCWRANLILKNIRSEREIMIDDGAMTITQFQSHIKDKKTFSRNKGFKDLLIRSMKLKPVKNISFRDNFEIFSIFSLPKSNFVKIRNEFKTLKKEISSRDIYQASAQAGFLGQGYVGDKYGINIDEYIETIKRFHNFTKKPIIYFPHRSESDEVRLAVSNLSFVSYHSSEWPIELEIYQNNIKLSSIAGVASTALYSLSVIYENIKIYNMKTKDGYSKDNGMVERLKLISQYYNNSNIIDI